MATVLNEGPDPDDVAAELKRLVARPLSPRHVATYRALPELPAVRAALPDGAGRTSLTRAILGVISEAIGSTDGQTLRFFGLPVIVADAATIQAALRELLGVSHYGPVEPAPASKRRAAAASSLGLDLATLGGERAFRQHHEPVLLGILVGQLTRTPATPSWFVDQVTYHYRYDSERVLASTDYRYELTSLRDADDFFINHTAADNLGEFELVSWSNCEVIERNQLANRTIELHFRLEDGAAGTETNFSYQLRPTDPQMSPDTPRLITMGQVGVGAVRYEVDFATSPQLVWRLAAIPPPLAGSPQLETPTTEGDPRLIAKPYDHVETSFARLVVRQFYGIEWRW